MHRTTRFLAITSLLILSSCSTTDNNVGTVPVDGGGAGRTSQSSGATSSQGGAGGTSGVGSDGGTPDAPQDSPGQAAQHPYVSNGASCVSYPSTGYRSFPFDPSIQTGQGGLGWPTCTLNCNVVLATAGNGQAPLDQALPDGPCDDEGASCNSPLMAGWCGPCANTGGPGNGYTCTCRAHRWQCALGPNGGTNMCDPPSCLTDSLMNPQPGCYQATWSATQVCACGKCKGLCSSDGDCQSGHCNLNQVCQFPDSCKGSADCRAPCTGLCEPAASDGGQTADVADAATVDSDGCPAPKVWRYEQPGCDGQVQPICGSATQDTCASVACGCDGESLSGCDYYSKPYRSKGGLCPGACLSPTHNLEVIGLIKGCACDPAKDQPQCVPVGAGRTGLALGFTCTGGVWSVTSLPSCNLGASCDVGAAVPPGAGGFNLSAPECSIGLCLKPVDQSTAGALDTSAFCTNHCVTDDDCTGGRNRDPQRSQRQDLHVRLHLRYALRQRRPLLPESLRLQGFHWGRQHSYADSLPGHRLPDLQSVKQRVAGPLLAGYFAARAGTSSLTFLSASERMKPFLASCTLSKRRHSPCIDTRTPRPSRFCSSSSPVRKPTTMSARSRTAVTARLRMFGAMNSRAATVRCGQFADRPAVMVAWRLPVVATERF